MVPFTLASNRAPQPTEGTSTEGGNDDPFNDPGAFKKQRTSLVYSHESSSLSSRLAVMVACFFLFTPLVVKFTQVFMHAIQIVNRLPCPGEIFVYGCRSRQALVVTGQRFIRIALQHVRFAKKPMDGGQSPASVTSLGATWRYCWQFLSD